MNEIATSANVTPATLYYHFKGKSDIFVETVALTGEFVRSAIEQIVQMRHLTVSQRIRTIISAWREGPQLDDELQGDNEPAGDEIKEHMLEDAMPHLSPAQQIRVKAAFDAAHSIVTNLMTEGVGTGELRNLPPEVMEYAFWHLFQPALYPKGMGRRFMDEHLLSLLLKGIET
jgi:AcrR family transcriptional regulator